MSRSIARARWNSLSPVEQLKSLLDYNLVPSDMTLEEVEARLGHTFELGIEPTVTIKEIRERKLLA